MPISRFFVDRPIFAWVVAIIIMLVGLGAILSLPIAQYPDIAPPSVSIRATYPGASADAIESSVTQVIEQQLTGVDHLLYFSSNSSSDGSVSITATFAKGTDPDVAQVQVQNRVQQAISRLPTQVQQQGLSVAKSNSDFLMVVAIYDETDRTSAADIADYLVSNFQEPLGRVNGVGDSRVFGSQYAMRVWMDPAKMAAVGLMPSDIRTALLAQNTDISAGQIGGLPAVDGQMLNAVVRAQSRLSTPEQFRAIVVKTRPDGSVVHLSDVARVELGQESYVASSRLNAHPASGIALMLAPGADALKTAELVRARVAELSGNMPAGYAIAYPRDSTEFVKLSIHEVIETLVIAILLVVVVMFVFLQNWRATLIPAIAVPVVLLGTFGVMAAFGFSINTLTLFGMVLAIGLLVDDAIVVVENVERVMAEEGLGPREATIKSMDEIGSALVGIALVLSAVMLPMAFFGGSTGVIYRQFSLTIVSSMVLSVVVALILSPALCATLLRATHGDPMQRKGPFGAFNRFFERMTGRYIHGVEHVIGARGLHLIVYGLMVALLGFLFLRLPTGFIPTEDQGQTMVMFTLPPGATQSRTDAVRSRIEHHYLVDEKKNVRLTMLITGFSFNGSGQNTGQGFVGLAPFDKRTAREDSSNAINARAMRYFSSFRDAQVIAMTPPSIRGLGQSNGFTFQLLNNAALSRQQFLNARNAIVDAAHKSPKLAQVRIGSIDDAPQLRVTIDNAKLAVLGLTSADVTSTLSAAWGSAYVNDFVDRGRVKRVFMEGIESSRMLPSDLDNWFVRSATNGNMVPFSAFATTSWEKGPNNLARFNGISSYEIQGEAAPGISSGEAMDEIARIQKEVAPQLTHAWSGLSYEEQVSSGQAPYLYALSILVVFLCLAALYESWSVPVAILLVLPIGIIGAVLAVTLRGLQNDIYFQVGLLTTIGLTAKNAILIVEFAEAARLRGEDMLHAAVEGARLRLRPILMTSIAFIAGVFPLAIASGAGAQSRIAIGTAVMGGMLTATAIAIFYVPMFFLLVGRIFHRPDRATPAPEAA